MVKSDTKANNDLQNTMLIIEPHEPYKKPGANSGSPEW